MKIVALLEALPIKLAKKYIKASSEAVQARYKEYFESFPNKDKRANRIYFPLPVKEKPVELKIDPKLVAFLKDQGFEIEDYVGGLAHKIDDPKRKIRIGKLLANEPILKNAFDSDKQRQASKKKELMVVISRHPYDIAGMSTGRGWTSCMNLKTGVYKGCVMWDVKLGTLVAYVINSDDLNIQHPISRLIIKPFHHEKNKNEVLLVSEDRQYGTEVPGFKEIVDNFCQEFNKTRSVGNYAISDKLYNDSLPQEIIRNYPRNIDVDTLSYKQVLGYIESLYSGEALKATDGNTISRLLAIYQKYPKDAEVFKGIIDVAPFMIKFLPELPIQRIKLALRTNSTAIQYIANPSEEVQLAAVENNGLAIEYIKNPSEEVQLAAVENDGYSIKYIKNPSEELQLAAVKFYYHALAHIKNPSEAVKFAAINQMGNAIQYIKNPTEEMKLAAVRNPGQSSNPLQWIKDPSEEIQLAAIKAGNRSVLLWIEKPTEKVQLLVIAKYPDLIEGIKNPSEKVQMAAVTKDPGYIRDIKNPTEKVQLYAIRKDPDLVTDIRNPCEHVKILAVTMDPRMIYYMPNPSEEVQLAAVRKDGDIISEIKNPSEAVQLAAVQQDGTAIAHIRKPSAAVITAAITQNPMAIEYFKNPSEEVQLIAVKQNPRAIEYIENPTKKVQLIAVTKNYKHIRDIHAPEPEVIALAKKLAAEAKAAKLKGKTK